MTYDEAEINRVLKEIRSVCIMLHRTLELQEPYTAHRYVLHLDWIISEIDDCLALKKPVTPEV